MNKTYLKTVAQDEIMKMLANTLVSFQEESNEFTQVEKQEIEKQIKAQANRVAKMFGYTNAWHN